ncbi:MAG: hypothetical protein AAFV07_21110, partial [Bacteroidota bacterium]
MLLFLPYFLTDIAASTWYPHWSVTSIGDFLSGFLYRENFDPFRLQGEFLLLISLGGWQRYRGKPWPKWFPLAYVGLLLYQSYDAASYEFFGAPPIWWNDLHLAWKVMPTYLTELSWNRAGWVVGILLGMAGSIWLLSALLLRAQKAFERMQRSRSGFFLFVCLWSWALLGTFYARTQPQRGRIYSTADWVWQKAGRSFLRSIKTASLTSQTLAGEAFLPLQPDMQVRPDIYLIFMESYGRVLQAHPDLWASFESIIQSHEGDLQAAGWQARSTWSMAPVSGGRSWLSFTSFMTGINVETHPQYDQLLHEAPDYPHLVRYLLAQDYETTRLNTMGVHTNQRHVPY